MVSHAPNVVQLLSRLSVVLARSMGDTCTSSGCLSRTHGGIQIRRILHLSRESQARIHVTLSRQCDPEMNTHLSLAHFDRNASGMERLRCPQQHVAPCAGTSWRSYCPVSPANLSTKLSKPQRAPLCCQAFHASVSVVEIRRTHCAKKGASLRPLQ